MLATLISSIFLFAAAFLSPLVAGFLVVTPDAITQCQLLTIQWDATKPPYTLAIVNPEDPCGEALEEFHNILENKFTWKVNIAAPRKIQFAVIDQVDDAGWTAERAILTSADSSCLGVAQAPNPTPTTTRSTTTPSQSPEDSIIPIGAANAGTNNALGSSALSMRPARSAVLFGALLLLVGVFAL